MKTKDSPEMSISIPSEPLLTTKTQDSGDDLRRFHHSLRWCLLDHSTATSRVVSRAAFLLLAAAAPAISAFVLKDPLNVDPTHFNKLVHIPSTGLAAVAFLTLPRRPLSVVAADSGKVSRRHAAEIGRAFRCLALILLPSSFIELAHKVALFNSAAEAPARAAALLALALASWVYRSGVFLLVCVMFRLTCELQILRLEGFQEMLESNVECDLIFKEHLRMRKQLWVTSHRYRFFIIGSLLIITVSQFGALLLVLGSKTQKNFLNSGDLVVCSAVEISGFFMCLVGAARITHRAQRIVSVATRWHMLVTCASSGPGQSKAQVQDQPNNYHDDDGNDDDNDDNQRHNGCEISSSDSDDSSDNFISVSPQDPSSLAIRQALVWYLEHNSGGITLFGFAIDRGLLHTLFAFEFSLVLWILSKVVVL